ncbi:hypothetical protein HPB48_013659 [Haemaphysalis longicornis]|uniref:Uncharacterized protein n=1 Tax=Haemaphysalis longicornis TaxID=44386 RepID=A0A9J6FX09_HAELO|nr:hypothetical protein HPB48_013659 [Haemaphysalis longicornis]
MNRLEKEVKLLINDQDQSRSEDQTSQSSKTPPQTAEAVSVVAACAPVAAAADGKSPTHSDLTPMHTEDGHTPTMDGKANSNEPQLPQTSFTLQSSDVNAYEGEELEDNGMEETEEEAATEEAEGWQ